MEALSRKLSSIPKHENEIARKPTLKTNTLEKIAAFKRRSSSCCGIINKLNEDKTIRKLLKLVETVKDETKVQRLCSPLKQAYPISKEQGLEAKNTQDFSITNKQLDEVDDCKESVSDSFSESSSDRSNSHKVPHIQDNHIITLRRPPKVKNSSQTMTFAYSFAQGKVMIKTLGQSIAANKSKPKQQQMDEVRIQIIRQINNNPNYSNLTIEEKKQLVEQKMNIREIKSNKNIMAQHSDNIIKPEDEKASENLKLAIKRLSTNLKIEKRAFSKVKESIRRNEKLSSDKHIDKIKSPIEKVNKSTIKSDSSLESSYEDDCDKETKESGISPRKSNIHKQNEKLIRKISTKIDDLFTNHLLSPLSTMGPSFRRKSPMGHIQNSDTRVPFYCEIIHEGKHSECKDLMKKPEQKFSRISTCFSPTEGSSKLILKVPIKEREIKVMNTSELFHQLQAAVTKKQYEMKGINADTEKFEMITKCFDLVTEYGKTRHKIKRLVKDTETSNSESPAKNQGN